MRFSLLLALLFAGTVFGQTRDALPGIMEGAAGEPRVLVTITPLSLQNFFVGVPEGHRPLDVCVLDPEPGVEYIAVVNRQSHRITASGCATFTIPVYDHRGHENAPRYIAVFPKD